MKKNMAVIVIVAVIGVLGAVFWLALSGGLYSAPSNNRNTSTLIATPAAAVTSPFYFDFSVNGILNETGSMNDSGSPYWWLNSGGLFLIQNGIGETIQGELATSSRWYLAYSRNNPIDTDGGYHPQNIFRLVTRSKWQNVRQEMYFSVAKSNLSKSPNRNVSNGLLLFNRYQDGANLYYTGIRVDGAAVIKKKINGIYYTMALKPFYNLSTPYSRTANPNLIPTDTWIGLRSEITNNPDNTVSIKLFIDEGKTGNWVLAAEATDDGKSYGGGAITNGGYAGVRTDFMDVQFSGYQLTSI